MNLISDIRTVVRYWWLFLLLGSLLIAFGLLVFSFPATAYADLTVLFIVAFFVNGLLETGFAISNHRLHSGWGWHLAGGLLDLAAAAVLFFTPILAAISLPFFTGLWLLFRSVSTIGRCFSLPVIWPEKAWLMALATGGLVFAFLILYYPVLGAYGLILWTGCALLSIGLFYLFLGLHLRRWNQSQ